nr:hypothetical protein [Tanacetum cinerariifolium]
MLQLPQKRHFARECRAPRSQGNINRDNTRMVVPVETPANALVVTDGMGYDWSYQAKKGPIDFALMAFSSSGSSSSNTETGLGYDSQLNERDLNNKSDVFESASDSSVNESEEDNNQENYRYKAGEGYYAVPPPYTGNFMPPRPDLSFARLDDSVFKPAISETITSLHETKTIASKTSKESMEKPKSVRPSAPIIEDSESDSDDDYEIRLSIEQNKHSTKQCDWIGCNDTKVLRITLGYNGFKLFFWRHLKLEDSNGISTLPNAEIFEQLALMGTYVAPTITQKLFINMRRASKGYFGVGVPLFQIMLVQGPILQGEGSTVLVESHHTPSDAPTTSQPLLSSPFRIPTRQETEVPQPSSPTHTHVVDEAASTGMDVRHGGAATTGRSMIEEIDQDAEVHLVTPTQVNTQGEAQSQESQPENQLGVFSDAKVLAEVDKVHTYTRRRRTNSIAKESVSTVCASMPVSTASIVDKAVRLQEQHDKEERQRIARVHEEASSFNVEEWEYIQATIEADEELALRMVKTFTPMKSDFDITIPKIADESSKRAIEEKLEQEISKRQKTRENLEPREKDDDELTQEDLQQMMTMVPVEELYVESL